MIFMNGKNNLDGDAINNFHAMASIGSTDAVTIVAQLGRPKKPKKIEGTWFGVHRFFVTKNQPPRPAHAVEKVADGAESDIGRVETLTNFVSWSKAAGSSLNATLAGNVYASLFQGQEMPAEHLLWRLKPQTLARRVVKSVAQGTDLLVPWAVTYWFLRRSALRGHARNCAAVHGRSSIGHGEGRARSRPV